jgi:hypothetical protein
MKYTRDEIVVIASAHIMLGTVGMWTFVALDLDRKLWFLLLPLASCQASLLSLWAAFGGKGTPWRSLACVLGVVSYYIVVQRYTEDRGLGIWVAILTVQTLPFVAALLLARLCGLEVRQCSHRAETAGSVLQFSLARAISWMTAIGICLGVLLSLPKRHHLVGEMELRVCLPCSIVAAASFWLVLGRTQFWLRLVTVVLSVAIGTFILATLRVEFVGIAFAFLVLAAWLAGSLAPVRLAGYRLTWRCRRRRQGAENDGVVGM